MSKNRMVALYARVSSDQQAKNDNVGSQIDLLKAKIEADGEILIEDMMFVDAGISGATLIRPQLERLRDTASLGVIDLLYILAPDPSIPKIRTPGPIDGRVCRHRR
jgi:site-specific DNA recombinase